MVCKAPVQLPVPTTIQAMADNLARTTPMTPTPSPSTSLAGRSGTFQDQPPKPSHQWTGDSPNNDRSAPVRRPSPAAGIAGTATPDTSASPSTWPIPTSCCRATDYESLPRCLWRLAQCRPPRSGPVCRPADTVPSCGVARGGMTNRMTVGAAFGHGQHPTTGGTHGASHRHRRHVLSRPRYRI
jgi:hypothetical protein